MINVSRTISDGNEDNLKISPQYWHFLSAEVKTMKIESEKKMKSLQKAKVVHLRQCILIMFFSLRYAEMWGYLQSMENMLL